MPQKRSRSCSARHEPEANTRRKRHDGREAEKRRRKSQPHPQHQCAKRANQAQNKRLQINVHNILQLLADKLLPRRVYSNYSKLMNSNSPLRLVCRSNLSVGRPQCGPRCGADTGRSWWNNKPTDGTTEPADWWSKDNQNLETNRSHNS